MTQPIKTITVTIPNGTSLVAGVPEEFDDDVLKLLFISILGAVNGIRFLKDEELKSSFMLRFTGEVVSLVENAIRTVQMANQLDTGSEADNNAKIIEQFLASLGKNDADQPK